jgi:HEAT repeat protein
MNSTRFPTTWLMLVIVASLGGCQELGDRKPPPRDFNELIPRFMNAANRGTPEEAAANLFNVTNPDERRDAIAYLETKPYGHQPPYMRAYEMLMTDSNPMVRAQVMRALGSSYQQEAVAHLVAGLEDPDPQVRRDAAIGLQFTFSSEAIGPLTRHATGDVDDDVRINAVRALQRADTPEGIRALISALEDKNAAVVFYAHQALGMLTHQDFKYDSDAWLAWYQQTYSAAPATRKSE